MINEHDVEFADLNQVVNGLGAARELLNKIEKGEETLHAIEVMACKGGCVGGGGQPCLLYTSL